MHQRIDYARLARRALANGYTTKSLGMQIGLSQPAVSRLANGKTAQLLADSAIALIRVAGGRVEIPDPADSASQASS